MLRRRLGLPVLLPAAFFGAAFVAAAAASAQPADPQPTLPQSVPAVTAPGSLDQIVGDPRPPLVVRRHAARRVAARRRHVARHSGVSPRDLDRPTLAGVELVAPLPLPGEPPHIVVPMPAYTLDSVVTALTTPPPPIVCHRSHRDPDAPDPHLYREVPVACEPDNP